jgi:hypothetical protein
MHNGSQRLTSNVNHGRATVTVSAWRRAQLSPPYESSSAALPPPSS